MGLSGGSLFGCQCTGMYHLYWVSAWLMQVPALMVELFRDLEHYYRFGLDVSAIRGGLAHSSPSL